MKTSCMFHTTWTFPIDFNVTYRREPFLSSHPFIRTSVSYATTPSIGQPPSKRHRTRRPEALLRVTDGTSSSNAGIRRPRLNQDLERRRSRTGCTSYFYLGSAASDTTSTCRTDSFSCSSFTVSRWEESPFKVSSASGPSVVHRGTKTASVCLAFTNVPSDHVWSRTDRGQVPSAPLIGPYLIEGQSCLFGSTRQGTPLVTPRWPRSAGLVLRSDPSLETDHDRLNVNSK